MIRARLIGCSTILGFSICYLALAETAYTTKSASLRAGPGRDYPLVSRIPSGRPVDVVGCLDDFAWCDVVAGPDRGWVYSGNLEYPYENRRVTILDEGPGIGLPIVTYAPGLYWDTYYRGRPWYGRRSYWVGRPFVSHGAWVRPYGAPGFGGPGSRPRVVRHPESRAPIVRRSEPRAPRPVDRPHIQPRPVERRPVEARPVNRPHAARPGRQEERKRTREKMISRRSPRKAVGLPG